MIIRDNVVANNSFYGIYLEGDENIGVLNVIENNTIESNHDGIYLYEQEAKLVDNIV